LNIIQYDQFWEDAMLEEQISKDYVTAMKARDSEKSSTLNFLRAQIKNVRIDKKLDEVDDLTVVAVIKKQVKQRQDSIEQYQKGGREDLVEKETKELNLLKTYLPEEVSADELESIIKQCIEELSAKTMKEMGQVMKAVMAKTEGRADNKLVSDLVKKLLLNQ